MRTVAVVICRGRLCRRAAAVTNGVVLVSAAQERGSDGRLPEEMAVGNVQSGALLYQEIYKRDKLWDDEKWEL